MRRAFLLLTFGLAAYELVALFNDREDDTISEIVWGVSDRHVFLPFAAGVVCGHFFWPRTLAPKAVVVNPGREPGSLRHQPVQLRGSRAE